MTDSKQEEVIQALRNAACDVRDCSKDCPVYYFCGEGTVCGGECVLEKAASMIESLGKKGEGS